MQFLDTGIEALILIKPKIWKDKRGYFFESFNAAQLKEAGYQYDWVQDNEAFSTYGAIRGIHFQHAPMAQAKLVRVVKGRVLDVVIDLRPSSTTFKEVRTFELSEENKNQLLIPGGFGHGYAVLSPEAIFVYKCDNYYSPQHEGGIRFDDPKLSIDWQIPKSDHNVSDKDLQLPFLDSLSF